MNDEERIQIKKIVNHIRTSPVDNKEAHFSLQYTTFRKKYPNLYTMACNDAISLDNLNFMLEMLKHMNQSGLSQHDASAQVGQLLYSQYVEPLVKKDTK